MEVSRITRTPSLILAGAALFSLASLANAQVTLNLTTTDQTNCVVVTDAQGLQSGQDTTTLTATGVTLNGTGCGGAGDSEFDAALSAPASAVAGTPFTITWSASEAATRCTYGGTAGVADWPVGTAACNGAACAGSHNKQVTLASAGAYDFSVTCTNESGFASDGLTATAPAQAPQPPNFALTGPATATVGTAISISWSVTGAQSCTGSASLGGSSTNVSGWTDNTSATSPRSVTFSQAGSYSLTLTCNNDVGSATSQAKSVTVEAQGGECPANRQTVANVCHAYASSGSACHMSQNVTEFKNIWGYMYDQTGGGFLPQLEFPGYNGYVVLPNMEKSKYIAAKFTVPTNLSTNQWGLLTHGETNGWAGPPITVSISQTCGDFAPADPKCLTENRAASQSLPRWSVPTWPNSACKVTPGETYYLNIKITDPDSTMDCTGTTCRMNIQSNRNP